MHKRYRHVKESLMCMIESQLADLSCVDAEEMGEVIDMIKDLEEAEYYESVVKAMEESEKYKNGNGHGEEMYYTPMSYRGDWEGYPMYYGEKMGHTDWRDEPRMYYDGRGRSNGNGNGNTSGMRGSNGNSAQYSEREFPGAFQDSREGRSYRSRRMYIEAKETKQDKTVQMKELEKYAQELTQDIVEMVQDASPEERQYLSKKIAALSNKVTQLNDSH